MFDEQMCNIICHHNVSIIYSFCVSFGFDHLCVFAVFLCTNRTKSKNILVQSESRISYITFVESVSVEIWWYSLKITQKNPNR